jgi:hypothetical protein
MNRYSGLLAVVFLAALLALMACGCSKSDDPNNRPPVISSLVADPDTFYSYQFTTVTVTAEDPDGDKLEYLWESTESWLTAMPSQGNAVQLTNCCPVEEVKSAEVIAIVRDGRGGEARDSVTVCACPAVR